MPQEGEDPVVVQFVIFQEGHRGFGRLYVFVSPDQLPVLRYHLVRILPDHYLIIKI